MKILKKVNEFEREIIINTSNKIKLRVIFMFQIKMSANILYQK